MGLLKDIELDNGVVINYHRVVSVNTITNVQNTIEVAGYTSKMKRQEEKDATEYNFPMNVYIDTKFIVADYDQNMTIDSAYDYLKALPEYEGAEDV